MQDGSHCNQTPAASVHRARENTVVAAPNPTAPSRVGRERTKDEPRAYNVSVSHALDSSSSP
ncbi:hypothetical protein JMJ77_0000256 [Colletotrichum scovillei]|uniref:Uncharacterized protein n=1 Tax=Colletotrichum scovillei TaxID=1209932 RepID=A0A9P7R9Z4_9PEZI|nr:hypothetical protein JMJ77_0000256 [Colletotrichum scovillei]KAG7071462.1 hypothetical protein JMJ76_0004334 [Colletotrichum scovillei]KAG7079712.1 hypothetical protein JMJ78_0006817 [Colletotrichum scovillei]